MRLQQFITESSNFDTDHWEELKNNLNRDCKPFIKELRGASELLYRGVKRSEIPDFYTIKTSRTNRRPRFVHMDLHNELGSYLKSKFGWNPRTEGLFTTKSISNAYSWGKPVIIFPIGKFKYIWIENAHDLYGSYDSYSDLDPDSPTRKLVFKNIKRIVDIEYNSTNLNKYLSIPSHTTTECIIKCDRYYSINIEWVETLKEYYCNRYQG